MTRLGLACGLCLIALSMFGCGDDDDGAMGSVEEDGGSSSGGKPSGGKPRKDAGSEMEADAASEGTVKLGMRLDDCKDAKDGAACGPNGGLICLSGSCVPSRCGDGFIDKALEECDDQNDTSGDGCEADCSFTCENDAMCDNGMACDGMERCLVDHTCERGTAAGDGTACTTTAISDGQCRQGKCTPAGCGDEEIKGGEQCDDGNDVAGDGCELDCTFSCEQDADCDDGSLCTGRETCDGGSHTCKAGTPLTCSDDSECTKDGCDPVAGCTFTLIDEDGDRHAAKMLTCGDDCDDSNANVYPGHPEMCDEIDHDCDPLTAPGGAPPTWYVDCDGDGYAAVDAPSKITCDMPVPDSCGGTWTTRVPDRADPATFDCNDAEVDAHPNQLGWFTDYAEGTSSWEYNCSPSIELQYTTVGVPADATCSALIKGTCSGKQGWISDGKPPGCGDTAKFTRCSIVFGRTLGDNCERTFFEQQQQCH